ncbi:putative T7SS-secreted protein [Streptomyces sp. NRRL F-5123]|uniref:putative T7SS-secreted protein n=1 Tax=Streptomyces sp. NRRL F-5123 TaxID=1463856 RepID=UPI0004E0DBD8|nr:toxin glutamine deamidase domain-containing protein [Streptomyces sp. NRRL F-5123]
MGIGSLVDEAGNVGGRLLDSAERKTGALIDDDARLVAGGLDALGLHRAADWAGKTGDHVADELGAHVPELDLGGSDDPGELLHGDPARIRATAAHLRRLHTALDTGHRGISRLGADDWRGQGGVAFRTAFTPQPTAWGRAASACQDAADAVERYACTVDWAKGRAAEAVRLWEGGVRASKKAAAAYDEQVARYEAARAAGGTVAAPAPFTDPGADAREAARDMLVAAREQRDAMARSTAAALHSAADLAPKMPSFTERLAARTEDLLSTVPIRLEHVAGGMVRAASDAVRFTRSLDPYDPYNLAHPAQYLTHLNATAAGLLDLAVHPERLPPAVLGTGWGRDGDEAAGRLLANLLYAVGTDGAAAARARAPGWRRAVPTHGTTLKDIRATLRGGPDGLQPVDPADQRALEAAVPRNRNGSFQRFPDPRGPWTARVNAGGMEVPGRSNNCADAVRSALETWYGNPQVAAARTLPHMGDEKLVLRTAERHGVEHGNAWGGTSMRYTGPGPESYRAVADELHASGHGSSALVHIEWQLPADGALSSHVFTALNHKGQVYWLDPQSGEVSTEQIHLSAAHVYHYALDARRHPIRQDAATAIAAGP